MYEISLRVLLDGSGLGTGHDGGGCCWRVGKMEVMLEKSESNKYSFGSEWGRRGSIWAHIQAGHRHPPQDSLKPIPDSF